MSYWISLQNEKNEIAQVESFIAGGTYVLGGSCEADLNITYNYSKLFNFRSLHEQKARGTIKILKETIKEYGIKKDSDYWKCTKGNVGYCLSILLNWALQYPEYKWNVN